MRPPDADRDPDASAPSQSGELALHAPQAAGDDDARAPEYRRDEDQRRVIDRRVAAVIEGMSDAFLAIGPDWKVTYANHEAARLNGTTPEALVGVDHWEYWPHTVGSDVERHYMRVVQERVPVTFEHHYEDNDVWHDIRAYPSDDGGLAVFFRDITSAKQLEAVRERQARSLAVARDEAVAAETQFRLLVERTRDYAVCVLDPDGIITSWGDGAARINQWSAGEAIGRHLRVLYPRQGAAEDGSAEDHLRHASRHGEYIGEGTRVRHGTEPFVARVVLTALRQGDELVGFSQIAQDLTGERERESALETAMEAARAASVAKSQFLANTSHEIRTPLNAIIGYGELLELGLAGPLTDAQQQYVGRIRATSRHLLGLINDILDLSRIESGQLRASSEPGLVADAVAAAIQLVEPQVRARAIALSNGAEGGAYRADPERVRQILVNLLSNAVRFTEPGGRVTITSGTTDRVPPESKLPANQSWTFIRVEDTGMGIPNDQLQRIWDAFVQVDSSRTRTVGGTGLGLTISRHLARIMGGDITVRSQPGLGSTFILWLPATDLSELPRAARRASDASSAARARADDEAPAEAFAELGDALLAETERVLATFVARLRADPATPLAHDTSEGDLEDHAATFIADVAQSLAAAGRTGIDAEAEARLHDGTAIQRLIAERHGEQRQRLAWSAEALRREYAILGEELQSALKRCRDGIGRVDVERARELMDALVERALVLSLGSLSGKAD